MCTQVTLTDMPEIVMDRILEESDFQSIQTLRKVCRDLRNYIDDSNPDSKLSRLQIWIASDNVTIDYNGNDSIIYKPVANGCEVKFRKNKRKFLKNEDFMKLSIRDLDQILKNQKLKMKEIEIFNGVLNEYYFREDVLKPYLRNLGEILKNRPRPLQVKNFKMDPQDQDEVLAILPYLDPNYIEKIEFHHTFFDDDGERPDDVIVIDELAKLEQWTNATDFNSQLYVSLENFMENFGHFEYVDVYTKGVTADELREVKETMLHSPTLEIAHIDFGFKRMRHPFGESTQEYNERHVYWYHRMPDSENVLQIDMDRKSNYFRFTIISPQDVVPDGIIRN